MRLAQHGGACGVAEHLDGSARHDLRANDRAHQRGLAAAGGAEQADDLAARDVQVDVRKDFVAAADHM